MNTMTHTLKQPLRPTSQQARRTALRAALARAGIALWRSLEGIGRARARRELDVLADQVALSQPEFSRQLRAASRYPTGV